MENILISWILQLFLYYFGRQVAWRGHLKKPSVPCYTKRTISRSSGSVYPRGHSSFDVFGSPCAFLPSRITTEHKVTPLFSHLAPNFVLRIQLCGTCRREYRSNLHCIWPGMMPNILQARSWEFLQNLSQAESYSPVPSLPDFYSMKPPFPSYLTTVQKFPLKECLKWPAFLKFFSIDSYMPQKFPSHWCHTSIMITCDITFLKQNQPHDNEIESTQHME